ncbi:hypothetical protein BJV85_003149 [Clostridium acetobutylicum]|uniref:Anti-SigV factor n=1 Tax=Clostridium acetobutylicum (strain ATCC 824 / DSM 792 / JCM 1419 / IAM 19013 / LMG 5710 / NBRC 13948 / NRRL B-527 / VKM B-1787 / 2291 / W) TaxID=272562 RepID=Q97KQ8_CLOAB|nr:MULTISPECIES: DUF3298 and DUF4163 domain-containing protein [Clostridium]AAK78835.1 putative anti-SigV factor [Clostridium acetobutylicum ATCC 824]ADZ19910.1 putative anti-SigV factor [Clostridium acetobutylicum EA 2018]AEI31476.1 putative anti-SigV factor [Clostridium acetobutylicum DSM 1731]AWV80554.1 DUF3298 domain-containing protein [Clostridium acetobutylicum]MBC2392744.1 DUF3298 and DUF4163 domain-containing protein [Clostridium acetobutylicum]
MYYICPYFLDKNGHRVQKTMVGKVALDEQKLTPQKFSITYPLIINLQDEKVKTKVNEDIVNQVSELFKNQVLLTEKIDLSEVFGAYEIGVNRNYILSILFSIYTYMNRAAHGLTVYSSITVNTRTGKVYSFSDLFNPKMNYLGELTTIVKKYIKDNNIQLIEDYKGVTNDQEFYLTNDKLVLYYQVYAYTPYYYGLFRIPIPYTEIKNLLGPMSPINNLI